MNNIYNRQKHLELLKYDQSLKLQGKSFLDEDRDKYAELLKYSVIMFGHIQWENRNQYLRLMEDFVDARITGKQFQTKFFKMFSVIEKMNRIMQADLILLQPNSKAHEFLMLPVET
jgi:hypothetical protein